MYIYIYIFMHMYIYVCVCVCVCVNTCRKMSKYVLTSMAVHVVITF